MANGRQTHPLYRPVSFWQLLGEIISLPGSNPWARPDRLPLLPWKSLLSVRLLTTTSAVST